MDMSTQVSFNTTALKAPVSGLKQDKSAAAPDKAAAAEAQPDAVVKLQGSLTKTRAASALKVDGGNAAAVAADIASLIGSLGMGVQANMNGFDAARLLA